MEKAHLVKKTHPTTSEQTEEQLLRSLDENEDTSAQDKKMNRIITTAYVILVFLGVGTGFLLSRTSVASTGSPSAIKTEKVVGIADEKTFKDSAVGTVEKGGMDDEGTHQLVRDGGPSQTVYLLSSVIDLDEYAGKKVKVWGQTMAAQKAAWLMDVGKIELQ